MTRLVVEFVVPGKPETDHRHSGVGRRSFHKPEYSAFLKSVHLHALSKRPRGWPLDRRYRISIVGVWPDRRPRDLDNLCKPVQDGISGALWTDDRQVDRIEVERGPVDKANPRTIVRVEVLEVK